MRNAMTPDTKQAHTRGTKLRNVYLSSLPAFTETPKAVYAALALSLALRLSDDDINAARSLLCQEWTTLHAGGLLPQKPRPQ